MTRTAVIVGAGPAGLTAAYELLARTDVRPIVLESESQVGGIAKTIVYHGNRMDLGGHRFFSKSEWVMRWWESILPVARPLDQSDAPLHLGYQGAHASYAPATRAPPDSDNVMLIRSRLSRIFYRRRFFDYPLKLDWRTFRNLGPTYMAQIAASYAQARVAPRKPEVSLEDFLINRFGDKLYRTFFKGYTEKVWGVPCQEISAEWGAQRIKGLSVTKAVWHAATRWYRSADTRQKSVETSLIERFLYPKFGPGQMWEQVTRRVTAQGGTVQLRQRVTGVRVHNDTISGVDVLDLDSRQTRHLPCDYLISSMPVAELVAQLAPQNERVAATAAGLPYRDFMTAGLLLRRMRGAATDDCADSAVSMPPDNWIYIQEPDVRLGRLQIFNNWSPAMVADPSTVWLGLEYFCAEGDGLWSTPDARFLDFAAAELEKIGLISRADVIDGTVIRVPKAYPAYFGKYRDIGVVREYLDQFRNLMAIGRNGMHRYNNQDHSMLAARAAVDCIAQGSTDRNALWAVNAEEEYHEEAKGEAA
jgi:protoporphyrinogen oxidase